MFTSPPSEQCRRIADRGDVTASAKRFWLLVPFILSLAFISSAQSVAGELTDALKARDVARVRGLLVAGGDVNEKVRGDYPLNVAAEGS